MNKKPNGKQTTALKFVNFNNFELIAIIKFRDSMLLIIEILLQREIMMLIIEIYERMYKWSTLKEVP